MFIFLNFIALIFSLYATSTSTNNTNIIDTDKKDSNNNNDPFNKISSLLRRKEIPLDHYPFLRPKTDIKLNRYPFFRPTTINITTTTTTNNRATHLNICFHTNEFNGRGTTVAIYDYAHYNEVLLGHKSTFIMPNTDAVIKGVSYDRFHQRFGPIHLYDPQGTNHLSITARQQQCDIIYLMKSGEARTPPSYERQFSCYGPPISVHGIFSWEEHGAAYALLSDEQIKTVSPTTYQTLQSTDDLDNHWVPHIVALPTLNKTEQQEVKKLNFRKKLKIPSKDVTVFCRHGGSGTFDIGYVQDAVCKIVKQFPSNTYFVFLGTTRWSNHQNCTANYPNNIHFLPETASTLIKEAYFQACDVMIHGRSDGEMFSMAIAEASIHNLPVITTVKPGTPRQPVVLQNKAFLFNDQSSLMKQLTHFIQNGVNKDKDYNAYHEYSPKAVMKRFSRIFIERPLQKTYLDPGAGECYMYYSNDVSAIRDILQQNETANHGNATISVKFEGVPKKTFSQRLGGSGGFKSSNSGGGNTAHKFVPLGDHSVHRGIGGEAGHSTMAHGMTHSHHNAGGSTNAPGRQQSGIHIHNHHKDGGHVTPPP